VLSDFVRSVVESRPVACPPVDGLRAAAVAIAASRAAADGGTVAITAEMLEAK
jgi:hypothetical protein